MEGGFQGIGFSSDNNNSAVPGITNANATNTMESYFQQHQTTSTHLYNQQQQQIYQNVNIDVTKSIQAAQAIAMKFHSQNKQKAQIEAQTQQLINGIPLPPLPQTILPPPSLPPSSYTSGQQQKRPTSFDVQHYQQLFQNRLQKAFLKNLEYIAKKDEEALQQQLQQIEQSKQYDQYLSHHSNMSLQQRQQHLQSSSTKQQKQQQTQVLTTKAGVGTGIRKRQSKEERLKIYAHIEDQCTKNSVYVMGIQIDRHSTSSGHTMEQDIHNDLYSLFQAYGSIHKVKLYKHFKTGQLKGDALITYQEDVDITLVCSQVSWRSFTIPFHEFLHFLGCTCTGTCLSVCVQIHYFHLLFVYLISIWKLFPSKQTINTKRHIHQSSYNTHTRAHRPY